ncbi:anti-repressor SinI family protein [Lentibacillus sp. N15]
MPDVWRFYVFWCKKSGEMMGLMKVIEGTKEGRVSDEWVTLILLAKKLGFTPDDIRKFLQANTKK